MYEQFYQFTGKPFQLSPDARFFFDSSAHHRAMAYLRYGVAQGEGFIVITGGIGTGKTMLVRNLFAELDDDEVRAAELVSTQIGDDDILRMITGAFGLKFEGFSKAALLSNLETFLRARHAEGRRCLIVVDEAQNLSLRAIEELRMLSNFACDGQALLQSFLIGQPELQHVLSDPRMEQVRQRTLAAYNLRALDRDESQAYIEHRLGAVGWQGTPVFHHEAVDAIFAATGGVPRRINTLCDRLLLYGAIEELIEFDTAAVATAVAELAAELGGGMAVPVAEQPPADSDLHARVRHLEREVARLRQISEQFREALNAPQDD